MRLGSYVHALSLLIHDMVYERDKWDETLAQWRGLDLRVSAAAWVMTGLVWVVRKLLELAYQGIHLVNASLSREMEFQADRVAVRMAGSQATCDVLYQLGPVSQAMDAATQQLGLALEHGLATDDVFYHQSRYLTEKLAARPAPPAPAPGELQRRFAPDEVTVVAMYASHPADYLREEQAQRIFVPGLTDNRSPWLLFDQPDQLRQAVTKTMYPAATAHTGPEIQPAAQVEEFLAAERADLEYAAHYAGTYDNRLTTLLNPADAEKITAETALPPGSLAEVRAALYGPELAQRTQAHTLRLADLQKLALFQRKLTKDASFVVAGQAYPASQASDVTARLQQEADAHATWLEGFDRQLLAVHWRMLAAQPERRAAWQARAGLQYAIQVALRDVRETGAAVTETLKEIETRGSLTESDISTYSSRLEQSRLTAERALQDTRKVPMLPLTHLTGFDTLADFVMQKIQRPGPVQFNGDWVNALFGMLNTAEERLRRVYFKNLGALLRLEEEAAAAHAAGVSAETSEAAVELSS
jgi:hypothetical protein